MSTTMSYVQSACNAAQVRNLTRVTPVHLLAHVSGTPLNGFVVLDAKGEFVAWADNISTAKGRCDGDPLAHSVERCRDGALMAWKYQRGKHRP